MFGAPAQLSMDRNVSFGEFRVFRNWPKDAVLNENRSVYTTPNAASGDARLCCFSILFILWPLVMSLVLAIMTPLFTGCKNDYGGWPVQNLVFPLIANMAALGVTRFVSVVQRER